MQLGATLGFIPTWSMSNNFFLQLLFSYPDCGTSEHDITPLLYSTGVTTVYFISIRLQKI